MAALLELVLELGELARPSADAVEDTVGLSERFVDEYQPVRERVGVPIRAGNAAAVSSAAAISWSCSSDTPRRSRSRRSSCSRSTSASV